MGREFLGAFEQLVLAALVRLGDQAYGMAVRQEIAERTGRDVASGAVYATLDRMEEKGRVMSRTGESTPERGGKAKRYFELTAAGEQALRDSVRQLERMVKGLKLGWTS